MSPVLLLVIAIFVLIALIVGGCKYFKYMDRQVAEAARMRSRSLVSQRQMRQAAQNWDTGMYPDLKKKNHRHYVSSAPSYFDQG